MIKENLLLCNVFCLSYGVFVLKKSKKFYKLISLRRKILPFSLFILDIPTVDFFWEIFVENSYEKFNKINAGDTVLDIGANVGIFSVKAALIAGPNSKIVAIEPEPRNLTLLKFNTKLFKNILIIPTAVGNISDKIDLNIHFTSGGHFIANNANLNKNYKKISVSIEKLDNIIAKLNLDLIDFVKIDVEGWEIEVLKGVKNFLKNIKFFAIASYHNENQKFVIKDYLEKENFKVINYKDKTFAWNKKFPH